MTYPFYFIKSNKKDSSSEAATQMAEYSAIFSMISPGMDMETATDGLVSVMKANFNVCLFV